MRLDAFLAEPLGSRSRAQRLIEDGRVLVDGAERPKRHVLAGGERIAVEEPDPDAPPGEAPEIPVAWEDDHLLVVDKPAGVMVHPAPGARDAPVLTAALAGRLAGGPDPARPGIVHRLDRGTSGLMAVTRTEPAWQALRDLMAARLVRREYLALVSGRPPARTGTIDAPLGRDRRVRTRMSTETDDPRDAITHFEVEQTLDGLTLLRVALQTGRTHQVRAHLRAIGHPVAGDPQYGSAGLLGLSRQFLHAARLAFDHPLTGEQLDLSSPLPPDLAAALERAAAG